MMLNSLYAPSRDTVLITALRFDGDHDRLVSLSGGLVAAVPSPQADLEYITNPPRQGRPRSYYEEDKLEALFRRH